MTAGAPYRFLAFDLSYFSAKVRPALRYKRLWYEEVPADLSVVYQRTGMNFIPIVITPEDATWQDSTDIYAHLEERYPDPPLFPMTPVQRVAAHLVELYVDEFALLPAMYTRWGTDERERYTRALFEATFGTQMGKLAADTMLSRRDSLGIESANATAIEAHTDDLLAALSSHFTDHRYLLGSRMSFADCALMGPLYGHFYIDLISRKLLLETALPVVSWIQRCNFPDSASHKDWFADDALSPSLIEVLTVMGRDAAPAILQMVRVVERWADDRPSDKAKAPHRLTVETITLRGTQIKRIVVPYSLWSLQQALDVYRGFNDDERARVDEAIKGTGWAEVLAYVPRHRLRKENFKLVFKDR
ncbi:MAG: glutathione S-transferase family protein [Myxococcales bacterium]|nr:glutathione S-transferase family protein [Myxococcales bacterium]MDH3843245.1 glutathione S-transferase family protein [Myxococcales bacterium]